MDQKPAVAFTPEQQGQVVIGMVGLAAAIGLVVADQQQGMAHVCGLLDGHGAVIECPAGLVEPGLEHLAIGARIVEILAVGQNEAQSRAACQRSLEGLEITRLDGIQMAFERAFEGTVVCGLRSRRSAADK